MRPVCKIKTIEKINYSTKWVEFWWKEDNSLKWTDCSKTGYFLNALEDSGIPLGKIHTRGVKGLQVVWVPLGSCGYEIKEIRSWK